MIIPNIFKNKKVPNHQPAIKPGRDLSTGMSFFYQDGCHFPWRQTSEAVDFYDGFIKKTSYWLRLAIPKLSLKKYTYPISLY